MKPNSGVGLHSVQSNLQSMMFNRIYSGSKKETYDSLSHFGGGLGDATVPQSGVWGRIPHSWFFNTEINWNDYTICVGLRSA